MRSVRYLLVVLPLVVGWADVARGEPPPVEESDRERARQLFDEANQFGKRGDYRKAKSSLAAAWALVKSWDIAVNLGTAELKLGQHRDAAEHLAWGVREGSIKVGETDEAVIKSRGLLAQAAMRVGTVKLSVDQPGATVLVDDKFVARSPLADPLYVEPGAHVISAHPNDSGAGPVDVHIQIGAGEVQDRFLRLRLPGPESPSPLGTSDQPADAGAKSMKARTIVAIGGGLLTAVAAGVALAYTLKASSARSDADDIKTRLGAGNCDQPSELCNRLVDAQQRRTDANLVATPTWITAGVLGAATLGTFLFWPKDSSNAAGTVAGVFVRVGPTSVALQGAF
jgi:hypothetical protein